ncbi:MAG: pyridoxamine 5'-phosphate oxidase family protein [Actinobacteria bacterium]|nr:pyridoxamine 5'-phosphate oxidase family protein [Actinomycetota bacterium]MDQ3531784.1 pyridoxamine 5'-phosphate oxidase family protein [Actinomycetota bacterium]
MERGEATPRTAVRRVAERGSHDPGLIDAVIDEAFICHLGFIEDGIPFVVPTIHGRLGDTVYFHGSPASRALRRSSGAEVCLTVTILDGLVLARSAFHHSMNYRSVMVLGRAREVTDAEEKLRALQALVEHVCPGRWEAARRPNLREFSKTLVVALSFEEASLKVRSGPPVDEDADHDLDVWAGVLPLETVARAAVPDELMKRKVPAPAHVRWTRPTERL